MTEPVQYSSPKEQCYDTRARMLKAMNEALAKPSPTERLVGVVTTYQDPQYGLDQSKIKLKPEVKIEHICLPENMICFTRVPETPTEAALRIVKRADMRKSFDCGYIGFNGY